MSRLIAFFVLLFTSGLALADSSSGSSNSHILNPDAVNNATDLSINYLSQLFGTVGNTLTGNSSQMMGKLFYTLNWGIIIVAGVVIGYAVLMSSVRMASEGVTMQPGKSTLFTCLKLGIGISLLIPSASTGYSPLQNIVMMVVKQGVGLADSIWDSGLEYLKEGGVVFSVPTSDNASTYEKYLSKDNRVALLGSNSPGASALAPKIFQSEVCMIGSRDPLNNTQTAPRPYYDYQADANNHVFKFPGVNDSGLTGSSCGQVSWNVAGSCNDPTKGDTCAISQSAMSQLILALMPAAKKYYCNGNPTAASCQGGNTFATPADGQSKLDLGLYPYLLNSLLAYYPNIQGLADENARQADAKKTQFIGAAESDGWLMAGRYYWNLMNITADSDKVHKLSRYTSIAYQQGPVQDLGVLPAGLKSSISMADQDMTNAADSSGFNAYLESVYSTKNSGTGSSGRYNQITKQNDNLISDGKAAGVVMATGVIDPVVGITFGVVITKINDITNMFQKFGDNYKYNPIQFLHDLGRKCIDLTMSIWFWAGLGMSASMLAMAVCPAANPLGFAASALIEWVKPLFMLLATLMWGAGFFLSDYVPIYPYIIFLFASVGWFISVIEAMVAAPLVALGLTHPENHDILGKVEQAVMLLLSVFIQPALLVIGLIAGIIFSFVSFQLLIYTFSGFMLDVMGSSSHSSSSDIFHAVSSSSLAEGGGLTVDLLLTPLLLVLFCTLVYTMLTQSFSLIFVLRDNVMRWIGAPSSGLANPEQLAQKVESVTSGAAQQAGKGLSDAAGSDTAAKKANELQDKAETAAASKGGA